MLPKLFHGSNTGRELAFALLGEGNKKGRRFMTSRNFFEALCLILKINADYVPTY
jgi:hypothetical protein